ncbi:MAG: hypothetical protein L0Z49_05150 [Actinobacteria bacterium]|nr:hypothetical protein [Actinomycetota bacterium]MCI0677655.1 hypothetical protein [Actinomycetota bacterium]
MSDETETERHPLRFVIRFLVLLGILAAAVRFLVSKREEYAGLTEAEAREKMEAKLGPRIGEEKASEIADQVIPVLKDRGIIKASPVEEVIDLTAGTGGETAETAEEELEKAGKD